MSEDTRDDMDGGKTGRPKGTSTTSLSAALYHSATYYPYPYLNACEGPPPDCCNDTHTRTTGYESIPARGRRRDAEAGAAGRAGVVPSHVGGVPRLSQFPVHVRGSTHQVKSSQVKGQLDEKGRRRGLGPWIGWAVGCTVQGNTR